MEGQQYQYTLILAPLLTSATATPALALGTLAMLVKLGKVRSAVLEAALAVTGLYSISVLLEGGPAMIAIAVGIGAVTGAQRQNDLQSAIQKGISARVKLAHALVVNDQLADCLSSVSMAVKVLIDAGRTEDEVVAAINTLATKENAVIQEASDADTAHLLAARDKNSQFLDERGPLVSLDEPAQEDVAVCHVDLTNAQLHLLGGVL